MIQSELMPDQCNGRSPRDVEGNALVADAVYVISMRGGRDSFVRVFEADCEMFCQPCRLDGKAIANSQPQRIDAVARGVSWRRV